MRGFLKFFAYIYNNCLEVFAKFDQIALTKVISIA